MVIQVEVADINDDNFYDIVCANINAPNTIFYGDKSLNYNTSDQFDKGNDLSYSLDVGDFDNDGDPDIVVGNSKSPNSVFFNLGKKGWKKELIKKENFNTYDIKAFDINGDSFLDIIESNSDDLNYYYINKKR